MYASKGLIDKNKDIDASFHMKRGQPFKYRMREDEHAREMGQKVQNQSIDHYSSVVQLQALMIHYGFSGVRVSHRKGPDVTGEYKGKRIALQYEHKNTRSADGLQLQYLGESKEFDIVKYIVPYDAYLKVSEAIGSENTIKRGEAVLDWLNSL